MSETKEFSVSTNGDRWSLETSDGETVVRHTANEPSGGHQTLTALATFLEERAGKPEHAALLQVLGQTQNEIEQQLRGHETDTSSHRTAMEYLRLGGQRLAKVDDDIVSTRTWDGEPPEAKAYWQANVEPLDEKGRREVALHLPSISDANPRPENIMVDERKDPGSDASRSDPETADQAREDLKKQAKKGMEKAMRADKSDGADIRPEQDPAEGSREVIERDLSR